MNPRVPMAAAGLFGAAGVILGAFGAHLLHAALAAGGMLEVWETAVRYQLIHAVALAAVAGWASRRPGRAVAWAVRAWIAGVFLFSGSLYALAMGGSRLWGPVTPLGGLCLLAGWLCLLASALSGKTDEP